MRLTSGWGLLAVALCCLVVDLASAQPVPDPGQDPVAGARVFGAKGCRACHSVNGVGGKTGPDLARVTRPRSFYDLGAAMWNHLPRMVDRMKDLGIDRPKLDARETSDLVAFLFTLNYFDPPGDRQKGEKAFTEKQCVVCHQVGSLGGVVGPSLDHLTQFGSPLYVAAAMWNHGPGMAAVIKEKAVGRPSLTPAELRDLIAFLAPGTGGPQEGPVYVLPGRAETGRRLFSDKRCIQCHGVGGSGGKVGPDLVQLGVRRSPVEFAAAMWNKQPAMIVAMRQRGIDVPHLQPHDMADLVAYLYSVRYFASGNASNGRKVALDKGCLHCHTMSGERGKPAPDLRRARGIGSPAAVIAALWNHTLVVPPAVGGRKPDWPQFSPAEMADLVALLESLAQPK